MEKSIKEQVASLQKRIGILENKIRALQELCAHEHKQVKSTRNNDDGWSICEVTWWKDFYCPDCDKYWSEEQLKKTKSLSSY